MIPLLNVYAGLAFMIMVLAIAISKMIGKTINKPDIEARANIEFSSLLITSLVYFIILSFYITLEQIAMEWTGFSTPLNKLSVNILQEVFKKLSQTWFHVISIEHILKIFEGATESMGPGLLNWQWKMFPGMTLYARAMDTTILILIVSIASLEAQIVGLNIITVISYNILLPLGLIFRIFPPLRNAGNELIAISISFGILIPFFYVITFKAMADIEHEFGIKGVLSSIIIDKDSVSMIEGETSDMAQKIVKTYHTIIMTGIAAIPTKLISILSYTHPLIMTGLTPLLLRVFSLMGVVITISTVIPSFTILLGLAFVKSIIDVLDFKPTAMGVLI